VHPRRQAEVLWGATVDEMVCLRKVEIPAENRAEFLTWIEEMRPLRQCMGCLMERVPEPIGSRETPCT
jgi:hypothetical protein